MHSAVYRSRRKSSRGFSLIEIVLVIGMIAAIAIGAFLLYPSVRTSRQAIAEQYNLQMIAGNIKHTFLLMGYQDLNNDLANQAMIFPKNMNENNFQAGQAITSSWGGPVTIGPSTDVNGFFRVVYEEVPGDICIDFSRGIAASYERVLIDDTPVRDVVGGSLLIADAVQIVNLCNSEDPVTIRVETQ